jgi:hypothetical protein
LLPVLLYDFAVTLLLLKSGVRPELELHLGFLDEEVEHLWRKFLKEGLIELELLGVVNLVELDHKIAV